MSILAYIRTPSGRRSLRHLTVVLPLLAVSGIAQAQCDGRPGPDGLTWSFDESERESFSLFGFLSNAVTPDLVKDTRKMRAYVRDGRFAELMLRCGDIRAVDAIYLKALKVAEHSISRALFLALMAVLEHKDLDVKLPLLGVLGIPLTLEEDSLFSVRLNHLPSKIYADTPPGGDRDKLQHFFGSAYLAYASESREFARSSGELVEWGEAKFVVGGVDDERDRRANRHGERFGRDLLSVRNLLPSDYLNLPYDE